MKRFESNSKIALALLTLMLGLFSCANRIEKPQVDSPTSAPNSSNESIKGNAVPEGFQTDNICSLPKQIAPNTSFANLGGGNWGRWNNSSNSEADFGCNGGKDMVTLKSEGETEIIAEFGAIGGMKTAHEISAEYMATHYSGPALDEKQYRQQFADFCNKMSEKLLGKKLPDGFTKRLLDEATFSPSGTRNEYAEQVGKGFVSLSSNKVKPSGVLLKLGFFSSEDEHKKYK